MGCEWTEASREHEQLEGKRLRTFRAAVLCALLAWPAAAVAFSPPPPPFYSAPLFILIPALPRPVPDSTAAAVVGFRVPFFRQKPRPGSRLDREEAGGGEKKTVASCGLCPLEG